MIDGANSMMALVSMRFVPQPLLIVTLLLADLLGFVPSDSLRFSRLVSCTLANGGDLSRCVLIEYVTMGGAGAVEVKQLNVRILSAVVETMHVIVGGISTHSIIVVGTSTHSFVVVTVSMHSIYLFRK